MKVLIINPPAVDNVKIVREGRCMQRQEAWGTSWAPLSLAIIAAILRNADFEVSLKDCSNDGISFEGLKSIITAFRPGLVIVNTSTPSISGDLKVATLAREIDKNIKTVFFGIHVTALPEETFGENPDVEFIALGEPEYTLKELALALRDRSDLGSVKGLARKVNGKILYNEKRPFIENLDELPFPAWDLVNIKGYRLPITNRPFLLVLSGRGCPHDCTFCAAHIFYGKKPRLRSPERIVSEMRHVKEKYGIKDFLFWSENSISDRRHMREISRLLETESLGVKWVCNGRVDMVDEELLARMKKAGCWMIGYGIEAGTQKVLDLMRKNIKVDDIERAVRLTKKAGIEVTGHVIVGFPGETKEDILETIKLMKRLDLDYIQIYCSVPFPGSRLYEEAKKNGWLASSGWPMFEQNFSVMNTPHISNHEVMALREKMIKSFYLDPVKILKTLLKIRSPREIIFFARFAAGYFTSWVNWLKLPQKRDIKNLDDPSITLIHAEIIQKKPFLRKLYADFYGEFKKSIDENARGELAVELGSGGGFIKEIIPEVVTSDVMNLPNVDRNFSGLDMPFENNAVSTFFMIDVLHHINDSGAFFRELDRCLKPGGKIVMIEPANTPWASFVYRNFHHEPFDPEGGWGFEGNGPLSSANGAIPWIIFYRDRKKFKSEFPSLKILKLKPHTPFRYLISGGVSFRQILPSFTYGLVKAVETLLSPLGGLLGMFMTIEIEKVK